jgi:glycolate oxidase FAD binding subunit
VTTLAPRTAAEVVDAVRWAMDAGEALEVVGTGTRRALGRPVEAPHVLDVSALRGVLEYEPEELILTVLPATPLVEIEALLAARRQCLAFEPSHLPDAGTIGGVVSTGLAGPRRPKAGAARDHVLGLTAVSGRGEVFKAGGKVVKNVTGYDLPKLITGSYGTLAVLTELTVKVLPAPEDTRTLILSGQSSADAVRTMTRVLQSTADASAACYLPSGVAAAAAIEGGAATAFRLEGVSPSVEFRLARLQQELAKEGSLSILDREPSLEFWRGIRDVAPFARDTGRMLWRVSVPPAQGAAVLATIQASLAEAQAFLDWGGGLIWIEAPAPADIAGAHACEQRIRASFAKSGGHAMLIRASAEMRRNVNVFQPQELSLAALSGRVKQQFDPKRVLNPGRMYAGV